MMKDSITLERKHDPGTGYDLWWVRYDRNDNTMNIVDVKSPVEALWWAAEFLQQSIGTEVRRIA